MLRFQAERSAAQQARRSRMGLPGRQRWRVWMLVIALGLVIATMRRLGEPETARRLDEVFSGRQGEVEVQQSSEQLAADVFRVPARPSAKKSDLASPDQFDGELSVVKDKTYFRPEETDVWFGLFARLQKENHQQLAAMSMGELTYAQLLQQPEVYRGRVVTVRGTVLREELLQAPENQLDIDSYHRLWITPRGGGQMPFVVYCLELPVGFPRGDKLRAVVSISGYFFKNWSYAWEEGLALAPVVLASGFDWQAPVARPKAAPVATHTLILAGLGAASAGLLAAWLAMRNTGRPTGAQRLRKLAEEESHA